MWSRDANVASQMGPPAPGVGLPNPAFCCGPFLREMSFPFEHLPFEHLPFYFCLSTSTRFDNKHRRSCLASRRSVSARGLVTQGRVPRSLMADELRRGAASPTRRDVVAPAFLQSRRAAGAQNLSAACLSSFCRGVDPGPLPLLVVWIHAVLCPKISPYSVLLCLFALRRRQRQRQRLMPGPPPPTLPPTPPTPPPPTLPEPPSEPPLLAFPSPLPPPLPLSPLPFDFCLEYHNPF